jgi:hypothetical protein
VEEQENVGSTEHQYWDKDRFEELDSPRGEDVITID